MTIVRQINLSIDRQYESPAWLGLDKFQSKPVHLYFSSRGCTSMHSVYSFASRVRTLMICRIDKHRLRQEEQKSAPRALSPSDFYVCVPRREIDNVSPANQKKIIARNNATSHGQKKTLRLRGEYYNHLEKG